MREPERLPDGPAGVSCDSFGVETTAFWTFVVNPHLPPFELVMETRPSTAIQKWARCESRSRTTESDLLMRQAESRRASLDIGAVLSVAIKLTAWIVSAVISD